MRLADYFTTYGDSGAPVFTVVDGHRRMVSGVNNGSYGIDGAYSHVTWVLSDLGFYTTDVIVSP